jgi:phage terminase small subunit
VPFPAWMPRTAAATWRRIVGGLRKAGVNLEQIDGEAVGFYTLCVDGAAAAAAKNDAKLTARFARDAIAWGNLIGASPSSRARLGIPPKKMPTAEDDAWAALDDGLPLTGNRELDVLLRRPRKPKVPPKVGPELSARKAAGRVMGARR